MADETLHPADLIVTTTKANDIASLFGGLFAPIFVWGSLDSIGGQPAEDFESVRGGLVLFAVQEMLGWPVLTAGFLFLSAYLAFIGAGAAWRLMDRRPAISAGVGGLAFHPSIRASPVPWEQVRSIRLASRGSTKFEITFVRRFWSVLAWTTSRRVSLYVGGLGLTVRDAANLAKQMNALRRAASP